MSKFSLQTLQEFVYPYQGASDPDVLLGPTFGEDIALTKIGNKILVSHVDPIIGAVANIGHLAVNIACNDIAASGVRPRWIHTLVIIPDRKDTDLLHQIMQDIHHAAREIQVAIIGGHSGYSSGVTRPLVSVTALGTADEGEPVLTTGAAVGDLILVTKGIALEGTAILASDFGETARELGLSEEDLDEAAALMGQISVIEDGVTLAKAGASSMHDVTRGGLLETLLEIALLSEVRINMDYDQLPIPDVVSRFAEHFQFEPLQMISSGTLAAAIPRERLVDAEKALQSREIPYAVIGEVVPGEGVSVRKGVEITHHTEIQAESDELARMWEIYPQPE